jgi:hypothetical protein
VAKVASSNTAVRKWATPFTWASNASRVAGLSAQALEMVINREVAAIKTKPPIAKANKTSIMEKPRFLLIAFSFLPESL